MRKTMVVVLILVVSGLCRGQVDTTQDWKNMPHLMQLGYVAGRLDGLGMTAAIKPDTDSSAKLYHCLLKMTLGQQVAIMNKYVNEHPEQWHIALALTYSVALVGACDTSK